MTTSVAPTGEGLRAQLDLNAPLTVARWRVIGNPIMAIPAMLFVSVLGMALGVVTFIAWWTILFTGNYPEQMFGFAVGVMRFQWRVGTFYTFMREPYPSFSLITTSADPGDDPATFSLPRPQNLSRGLIFIKVFLLIPVFLVLFVLGIGAYFALIIGFFSVLFTGQWPEGMRKYIIGVARLAFRANAYYYLLTDVYPGFSTQ